MNTKARHMYVAILILLMLGCGSALEAQTLLYKDDQIHVAPNPIAVTEAAGASTVIMTLARYEAAGAAQDISSMLLALEGDPTATMNPTLVGPVRVYFYNEPITPANLASATRIDDLAGYEFSGSTLTVNLDISKFTIISTPPNNYVAIVFDFDPSQDTTKTVACEIVSVVCGPDGSGVGGTCEATAGINTWSDLTDFKTTIVGTDISPVTAEQTEQNVPVLNLFLDPQEDYAVTLDSIRVHSVGTPGEDDDVASVKLFRDANGNGTFEAGADTLLVTGTLAGGYAMLNPTAGELIEPTGATFFIVVNVASKTYAGVDNVIGFEVEDPSSDIAFIDTITSGNNLFYTDQKGHIVQDTPTANGTFIIAEFLEPDTTPPTVQAVVPTGSEVITSSKILIIFSENMDHTQLPPVNMSNVEFKKEVSGTPVAATYSYNDTTHTLTIVPDELDTSTVYRVTVKGESSGGTVRDEALNYMASDYTWVFTTAAGFSEPIALNNRIQPGVNDHTEIHIPQPPASAGGADALVTVQVFTSTGKRVATLKNAVRYSVLEPDLPLSWYGKNNQGDDLGPGVYFIRISATGWVRTLKVMVVR